MLYEKLFCRLSFVVEHFRCLFCVVKCTILVQVERLPVYWKQRRMMFFDAFSFAFPAALQRIPYSLFVSLIWTVVTYFPVGLSAEPSRCALVLCYATLCCAVLCMLCCAALQCAMLLNVKLHQTSNPHNADRNTVRPFSLHHMWLSRKKHFLGVLGNPNSNAM